MTHGDFHMGNVAFTSHNSAVTFFDLQVSRQNSGVTDLVQYLVQVGGYAAQCRVRDIVPGYHRQPEGDNVARVHRLLL